MGKVISIIAILVVTGGVIWGLTSSSDKQNSETNASAEPGSNQISNYSNKNSQLNETNIDSGDKMNDTVSNAQYIDYSTSAVDQTKDKTQILFFHAKWCPTCKAADQEFSSNLNELPNDIVILKTDYDTENTLKDKYGITYQHTFVQIDQNGNEITKWNGGDIEKLKTSIR